MSGLIANSRPITSPDFSQIVWGRIPFEHSYSGGFWGRLWQKLTGRQHHLYDLAEAAPPGSIKSRHYIGLRNVPIQQIQGSEGRAGDFTRDFRPLRKHTQQRWQNIATLFALGYGLPPVELIRVGDIYFVRDGHHRISVAKARGVTEIEALVTVFQV